MSQSTALMAFGELTEQDIITVRETIAKDCNDSQFRLFMGIAKASGANPILQEIHPSVFQGKLTVQFGIDFHVRKAKETEGYLGYDVQLVHENDEFKMHQERADDGRYYAVIDEHSWGFPRGKVIGGYAAAYKEGLSPFTVVMDVEEVEHFKRSQIGMQKTMWTNFFNDMFKKHMVRRALKAAFGLRFDDMDADAAPSEYTAPERKDITEEANAAAAADQTPKQTEPEPEKTESEADIMKRLAKQIKVKLDELGVPSGKGEEPAAAREKYYTQIGAKFKDPTAPTIAELNSLVKLLDQQIEMKKLMADDELE